jgi:hypothetical protein
VIEDNVWAGIIFSADENDPRGVCPRWGRWASGGKRENGKRVNHDDLTSNLLTRAT